MNRSDQGVASTLADRWARLADLFLPASCGGCERAVLCPGTAGVCSECVRELQAKPTAVRPRPAPPGLPPVVAAARYADRVRAMLIRQKEHDRQDVTRYLAGALANAIAAAIGGPATPIPSIPSIPSLSLVPVPSSRSSVRARGQDPVGRMAKLASCMLTRAGVRTEVVPALRHARPIADQAGLNRRDRALNLAGAYCVVPRRAERIAGTALIVDDVITTGATGAEAARALRAAGVDPAAVAVVAATPRPQR